MYCYPFLPTCDEFKPATRLPGPKQVFSYYNMYSPLEEDTGLEIHRGQKLHLHRGHSSPPSMQLLPAPHPHSLLILRSHSPFSHRFCRPPSCRPKVHTPIHSSPSQVQLHTTTEADPAPSDYLNSTVFTGTEYGRPRSFSGGPKSTQAPTHKWQPSS